MVFFKIRQRLTSHRDRRSFVTLGYSWLSSQCLVDQVDVDNVVDASQMSESLCDRHVIYTTNQCALAHVISRLYLRLDATTAEGFSSEAVINFMIHKTMPGDCDPEIKSVLDEYFQKVALLEMDNDNSFRSRAKLDELISPHLAEIAIRKFREECGQDTDRWFGHGHFLERDQFQYQFIL